MTIKMKRTVLAMLLAVLILSACSDRSENPDIPDPGADAPVTAPAPETTAPQDEPKVPSVAEQMEGLSHKVLYNPSNMKITAALTGGAYHKEFVYSDQYLIVMSWDFMSDKGGMDLQIPENLRLKVLDLRTGEFTDDMHFAGTDIPNEISYYEGGCYLYCNTAAWKAVIREGKITVEPASLKKIEVLGYRYKSPDGKWTAYERNMSAYDPGNAYGKIHLQNSAGKDTVILENAAQPYRAYRLLGFLDNTRLAYSLHTGQWGIYNVESARHITGDGIPVGIYEGAIYTVDNLTEPQKLMRIDADGKSTVLAQKGEKSSPLFSAESGQGYRMYTMQNGLWIVMPYVREGEEGWYTRTYIYSADTKTQLAEILIGRDGGSDFWYTDGKALTLVRP